MDDRRGGTGDTGDTGGAASRDGPSSAAATSPTVSSASQSKPSSILPRVASGSVGSIATALAATPLEVVKVRQQAAASSSPPPSSYSLGSVVTAGGRPPPLTTTNLPEGVVRCRGCGTFVLNNGLMDCVLPRSAVPYFDGRTGTLTEDARAHMRGLAAAAAGGNGEDAGLSKAAAATKGTGRYGAVRRSDGTFAVLRRIFLTEGLPGIYAGLAPTLVMSVPNTVLYFTAYDEIVGRLRARRRAQAAQAGARDDVGAPLLGSPVEEAVGGDLRSSSAYDDVLVPLVGGSSARFLASAVTSPLELMRTRRASLVGSGVAPPDGDPARGGILAELRLMIRTEGGPSALFRGVSPTLWRDVPFSAVYWVFLERFKSRLARSDVPVLGGARYAEMGMEVPPVLQAGQAFVGGAAAGMIAASCTTPFDVVKTRRQMAVQWGPSAAAAACDHGGAAVYEPLPSGVTSAEAGMEGTIAHLRRIASEEGLAALWRGNVARTIKVAPACAIMISCYELGKRVLGP